MENYYKKTPSENKFLTFVTPSVALSNSNKVNTNHNNTKNNTNNNNALKKILFKTPNKTPLDLSSKKKTPHGGCINDRYIPNRNGSNMEASYHLLQNTNSKENIQHDSNTNIDNHQLSLVDNIKRKLIADTCNGIQENSKILNLHMKQTSSSSSSFETDQCNSVENIKSIYSLKKAIQRTIPSSPERILDAPEFRDDYYLNLIDWSSSNFLAVALHKELYLWNAAGGEISQLLSMDEDTSDYITSTAWNPIKDNVLAVGNSKSLVELWDVEKQICIRKLKSHLTRVGSLAWNHHILTSGSRSGVIHHHDVRVQSHHVATLKLHEQEVCGLKWSHDGRYLASGANDNQVSIWDLNMSHEVNPLFLFKEHTAAVKAVSWCPWQNNVLATGGGTADGKIKIWNIYNGNVLQTVDAKSQISSIIWSKDFKEIISSHGYSLNQLTVWKYPEMVRICDLSGHTSRVLMMTMSPDQETVASAGADETLRLWKCFGLNDKQRKAKKNQLLTDKKSAIHTSLSSCIR